MWVQEIEFDMSQDPPLCLSEGGIQNVGEITIAELRIAAEQEFGQYVEDLTDPDNGDAPPWLIRSKIAECYFQNSDYSNAIKNYQKNYYDTSLKNNHKYADTMRIFKF